MALLESFNPCCFYTSKVDGEGERQITTIGSPIQDFLPAMEDYTTGLGMTLNYSVKAEQLIKDDSVEPIQGALCWHREQSAEHILDFIDDVRAWYSAPGEK